MIVPRETLDLTPREREIVRLLGRDFKQAQIAAELGISVRTVESHLARIRAKTGASTTATALLRASARTPGGAASG